MSQDALRIVQELMEANAHDNMERVTELSGSGLEVTEPESLPFGGTYRGVNAIPELLGELNDTWEEMDFDMEWMTSDDERVFVRFELGLTAPNGQSVQTKLLEIYEVQNGEIADVEAFYYDTAELANVLD